MPAVFTIVTENRAPVKGARQDRAACYATATHNTAAKMWAA